MLVLFRCLQSFSRAAGLVPRRVINGRGKQLTSALPID